MDIVKILISKLLQEKIEKEHLLEKVINTVSPLQLEDSIKLLKELSVINNSIILLETYLPKEEEKKVNE